MSCAGFSGSPLRSLEGCAHAPKDSGYVQECNVSPFVNPALRPLRLRLFNTAALACSRSGKRRMDLLLLLLLLELGFCFMTVASVPPINDQRKWTTLTARHVRYRAVPRTNGTPTPSSQVPGRQPKCTQVEGADTVMQSSRVWHFKCPATRHTGS